jgi:acetate kinase
MDIIKDGFDARLSMARRMLRYHIVRYSGAFIATLGGIDAFVFLAERAVEASGFIGEVLGDLAFLNLNYRPSRDSPRPFQDAAGAGSAIPIFLLDCHDWEIMQDHVNSFLNQGD